MVPRSQPLLAVLVLATACAPAAVRAPDAPSQPYTEPVAAAHREPGSLHVQVSGPAAVPFGMTAIGLNDAEIALVVRNESPDAVPLAPLAMRFTAERDGVRFRCERAHEESERDPTVLASGKVFTTTRILHCWTPVPGRYVIGWSLALGRGGAQVSEGSFALVVEDHPTLGPRAVPERPGVYVAMGGDRRVPPIPVRRDGREDGYHAVIVISNAGPTKVTGGRVQIAFVVRKKGSPLPCGGETFTRVLPAVIEPGEVSVVRVPVTCISDVAGEYGVTGQLAFAEPPSEAMDVGSFDVRVTRDPLLLWPSTP